jgi:hypothetical protein
MPLETLSSMTHTFSFPPILVQVPSLAPFSFHFLLAIHKGCGSLELYPRSMLCCSSKPREQYLIQWFPKFLFPNNFKNCIFNIDLFQEFQAHRSICPTDICKWVSISTGNSIWSKQSTCFFFPPRTWLPFSPSPVSLSSYPTLQPLSPYTSVIPSIWT